MTKTPNNAALPQRYVRMWHRKEDDEWCHAWDVEDSHFRLWKAGKVPLRASSVYLPSGNHPPVATQVRCGTCGSTWVVPNEMKQEFCRRETE